ncbi:annexin A4-like [Uloborus diversus]|uniref:annexin A4-like n=1 Tax=Uloborus diversus TaxID=327109 RepID=UPI0024099274|nr:annexin A4-like [Uloborus diversus]
MKKGTIGPASNFNAEKIATKLRKAMRGIGTDEKVIIDVFTGHNNSQRQIIKKKYKTIYGRVLADDIKAELGGHFEDVCLALLTPLAEYLVDCLYYALKGYKPDDKCIIEILVSLEYLAGLSKSWGTDEDLFITVLATRSKMQLQATIAAYERVSGHLLEETIKSEFGGNIRHALLAIVECIDNRPAFFAKQLHQALNGPGTDDKTIIRILVSRSEVDLADIYEWYHMKYDVDLSEAIYADTSGDYRKILMKILNP